MPISNPTSSINYLANNWAIGDSITTEKMNNIEQGIVNLQQELRSISFDNTNYITPEMYGAIGDGEHDDGPALQAALASGKLVKLTQNLHIFSNIVVRDTNVTLYGQGYTLFLHGENMSGNVSKGGNGGKCIIIGSTWNDGIIEDADVVIYTETSTAVMNPAFPDQNSYHRGYLSYHGFNPTPDKETYEEYTTHSWKEYRVRIQDCRFIGDHTDGLTYLQLNLTCHSLIDNCDFICTTDDGAAIGVQAHYCYDTMITHVRAENFTAKTSRRYVSTGYGIQAIGDAITISNCILKNCKNHINIGGGAGNSGIFTTGAIMENIVLETQDTGAKTTEGSNANLYQQMLDLHEGCHKPIVSNVTLLYDNELHADNNGSLIHISCPEAVISNVTCKFAKPWGNWARGYFGFGPLAKRMWFYNIHATGCYLFGHGWGFERNSAGDANYMREINIIGGEIGGIHESYRINQGLLKIRLSGVTITGLVGCSHLYAENCIFKNTDRLDNGPQITIEQEGFFTNCDIYGYTLGPHKKSAPVIKAPTNAIWMTNCIIRKPLNEPIFKTEQTHLINNAIYDLYGLILGSQVSDLYVDGDECILDEYNLW